MDLQQGPGARGHGGRIAPRSGGGQLAGRPGAPVPAPPSSGGGRGRTRPRVPLRSTPGAVAILPPLPLTQRTSRRMIQWRRWARANPPEGRPPKPRLRPPPRGVAEQRNSNDLSPPPLLAAPPVGEEAAPCAVPRRTPTGRKPFTHLQGDFH